MYKLSRALMMMSALAGFYCLIVLALLFRPASYWLLGLVLLATIIRRRQTPLTTLGSGRLADQDDLRKAQMLGAESGIIVGRMPVSRMRGGERLKLLFDRRVRDREACRALWLDPRRTGGDLVRLSKAIHVAVFSPSGGGKGVSILTPYALDCPDSMVIFDPKGELAMRVARHREKRFGHRIALLDPYRIFTQVPDCFNPFDTIPIDSHLIDACNDIADALVVRTGEERERHFDDCAGHAIGAMSTVVAMHGTPDESRSLQTLRAFISDPEKFDFAVQVLRESQEWDGIPARIGGQLLHLVDKERSSVLSTVGRHTRFLDTPAVAESTRASSFDATELRNGKMTIFLILPPEHLRAQAALVRMWLSSLLRVVVQGGVQDHTRVHFVIDEAGALQRFDPIVDAVTQYRGHGVRMTLAYQSPSQLRACFGEGTDETLLGNCSHIHFGTNELSVAEKLSKRIGDCTIIKKSGGTNSGSVTQWTEGRDSSSGGSFSSGTSTGWDQVARNVMRPEEILNLDPQLAITFTPGVPPVLTRLVPFYRAKWLGKRRGWFWRCVEATMILVCSAAVLTGMLLLAAELTRVAHRALAPEATATEYPTFYRDR